MPPFVAGRVLSIWGPLFRLEVGIQEMRRIEMRAEFVSSRADQPIVLYLLAEY
jgi:hypothetical protein